MLDEDGVDLVVGGYGTNTVLPAMPLIIERERYFVGLMGLGVNNALSYPNYFAMIPTGPDPTTALTEGFFEIAAQQTPRPVTMTILSADAVFSKNPIFGARANAEKYGFTIVHEAEYPLATTDFPSILDTVAASNCDLLFLSSYIQDSIDLVRALREHSFRPKMVGASMIGSQNTSVKTALGPLLNGLVNYEYWVPVSTMMFPGVEIFLNTYRERARHEGVNLLGHYMAPLAYAQMQVVAKAITSTGGLDDQALSNFTRNTVFDTVMGEIRFGKNGEWETPRVVQVQFQGIDGHDADQFKDGSKQIVVSPGGLASGELIYPYASAL